jgi:hypothetical protein
MLNKLKHNKINKGFFYGAFILLFIFSTLPSVFYSSNVSAADDTKSACDEAFYSSNSILFYNPCETTCNTSTNGAATVSSVHGKNNGEKIFHFWVDAGLTPQQAAGITGSMQHEGSFSPFRQEGVFSPGDNGSWPGGGWGIAQFTGGQRAAATDAVKTAVGADTFNKYYSVGYGGPVLESNGFVPVSVPTDVNDKFLLAELNYLLGYIKAFKPSSISDRVDGLKQDFNQSVDPNASLYDYLKTLTKPGDAAVAWTYLYEYPGDIKATASDRATSAASIFSMYSGATSTGCGGDLVAGGMTLDQAVKFMDSYKNNPNNVKYIGGAAQDCPGGPLSNCVSFSVYFVNKYTNIQGMGDGTSSGNGSTVAANIIARNPSIQNGHTPRPYAIFSTPSGSQMCGDVKCGHTGVILGVDTDRGKVIVGEAGCGTPASWDTAREYSLAQFNSADYTYVYTDGLLKGAIQ